MPRRSIACIAVLFGLTTACGGGDDDVVAEAGEVSAFCDTLAGSSGKSIQQTWVSLRDVAPTSEIRSALEAMVSLNDPESRTHAKVDAFARERCEAGVPGGR